MPVLFHTPHFFRRAVKLLLQKYIDDISEFVKSMRRLISRRLFHAQSATAPSWPSLAIHAIGPLKPRAPAQAAPL